MKEDENKTTQQSAAAAEQPENTQPVAAAETPDTTTGGGAAVEGPGDAPRDGEGRESVTVVIIARKVDHAALMARSVVANLQGVDAEILVATGESLKDTDAETLLTILPRVQTERIILMTDGMVILNPVVLPHVAAPKALKIGTHDNGDDMLSFITHMPQMMYKSVLEPILKSIVERHPHTDIFEAYGFEAFFGVRPIVLPAWNQEAWLLPVVSKNPPLEALQKWAKTQRFAWIAPQSWTDTVVKFLEERFPE